MVMKTNPKKYFEWAKKLQKKLSQSCDYERRKACRVRVLLLIRWHMFAPEMFLRLYRRLMSQLPLLGKRQVLLI